MFSGIKLRSNSRAYFNRHRPVWGVQCSSCCAVDCVQVIQQANNPTVQQAIQREGKQQSQEGNRTRQDRTGFSSTSLVYDRNCNLQCSLSLWIAQVRHSFNAVRCYWEPIGLRFMEESKWNPLLFFREKDRNYDCGVSNVGCDCWIEWMCGCVCRVGVGPQTHKKSNDFKKMKKMRESFF